MNNSTQTHTTKFSITCPACQQIPAKSRQAKTNREIKHMQLTDYDPNTATQMTAAELVASIRS